MAIIVVNGESIEIGDHEQLNGIQAAQRAGVQIPHYCWHAGLSVVASCRMCLVETGTRDPRTGEIKISPKLSPACQTPANDGTVLVTDSEKVRAARAMVEEELLIRHPIDCPICDKAGECSLQDYHFEHGQEQRRADIKPFTSRRRTLGPTVTLFVDRCVMCTRCVRFTREISGTRELMVTHRGSQEEIDVFPGFPLDNKMSGNVVDLCPVGALGDRDFLYQQRVWFLKSHDGVCSGCSTGCSIKIEENQDHIYRLKPRENLAVNGWWMCDDGRYGWKHVHDGHRRNQPEQRVDGQFVARDWPELQQKLDRQLRAAGRLAVVLSPFLTVEEAYLLARYVRGIDAQALLAVGKIPVAGEDETFSTGLSQRDFTIRAEKCPNRRGVEAVASRVGGALVGWDELLERIERDGIRGIWISGGYPGPWHTEDEASQLAQGRLTVVQDLFESPLWDLATFRLPGAAFAEREGSFVNHADRLQSFAWAIRPPTGVLTDGQLAWRLLGRAGLYSARRVMVEIATEFAYFAAAARTPPETGIDLKLNQFVENAS